MPELLTLADIQEARHRISSSVRRTPLSISQTLSKRLNTNAYVKLELFQKTGSFKVRGVFNKALALDPEVLAKGLVTISGGNHAQAVAYVARQVKTKAVVIMPKGAPAFQVEASKGYGAEIEFAESSQEAVEKMVKAKDAGMTAVHPFEDPLIMAGQGTLGLEILEDTPQVTDLLLGVGGGGLMAGVAAAVKSLKPDVRLWGVETEGANCMAKSLVANRVLSMETISSVARSLGAAAPSDVTFAMAQKWLESVTVVPDEDALAAQKFLLERLKVLTEPAASCVLAAADRLRAQFSADSHVVLLLGGGNVSANLR